RGGGAGKGGVAGGELGPAVSDGELKRSQCEREQREINPAPPENQRARDEGGRGDKGNREQERWNDLAGKPVPLAQGGGISAESEPRAVTERDEAGIADQHIESHAGNGEHHHVD